ncbi:MAG: HU family DNA-binding protein [Clostridia bacterium]|nr:HU family DNA-binding protein [Clostridia bacterium]
MNRSELVNAIAEKSGVTKKVADSMLKAFIETVEGAVKKGDKVQLIGFGTFESKARAARTGKNPRTGEAIKIAAAKVPAFKAGAAFKDLLNK